MQEAATPRMVCESRGSIGRDAWFTDHPDALITWPRLRCVATGSVRCSARPLATRCGGAGAYPCNGMEVVLTTKTRTPLGAEQTRIVLRRAAELDREHAPAPLPVAAEEPRLDAADLERIAAESGLSRESLRRAIDELGGGVLDGGEEASHRLEAGPRAAQAVAQRTFAEPAAVIEQRLSAALEESGLEPVRRAPHATRWEPAAGLRHALGRAVDWRGTSAWIGSAVESSVYAVPGERSSAELRGNTKDLRLPIATIAALVLAVPAGIALLVALAIGLSAGFAPRHALACLVIVASWVMLSALISRGVARRRVRKLRRSLERLLAQLGQPAHP